MKITDTTPSKSHHGHEHGGRCAAGFTLLELVLAVGITATLFAALAAVFANTLHARERSGEVAQAAWLRTRCLNQMRTDLYHMAAPDGRLAQGVTGKKLEEDARRRDSLVFDSAVNRVHADVFGSDLVRVAYVLDDAEENDDADTLKLIRQVWRNPLSPSTEEPEERLLLDAVESMAIDYFDGSNWVVSWDTELQDNALPRAIRITLEQHAGDHTVTLATVIPIPVMQREQISQEGRGGTSG